MSVSSKRVLPPLLILVVSLAMSGLLLQGQPSAEPIERESAPPAVRILDVEPKTLRLHVESQGTVAPRTESQLVAEVPGKIVRIGRGLEPGAFFRAGELLVELDAHDLGLDLKRARAALERAAAEEEFAGATLARQKTLFEKGITSDAIIDEARRSARVSKASRLEAEANLERALRDLERTRILAPFDGRTLSRSIDKGRFVSSGTPLATLHAVEDAEVRLPIPDAELAYLDLPIGKEVAPEDAPDVSLTTRFAGREHRWRGRIVRTEAQIDPRTRMVHVVARVERPYESAAANDRPPLAAGLFVEARIEGRQVPGLVRVPRSALADEASVWVVDIDNRLRRRPVEVFRVERDSVLVSDGLDATDLISLLEPRLAREGLIVEPVREAAIARSLDDRESAS